MTRDDVVGDKREVDATDHPDRDRVAALGRSLWRFVAALLVIASCAGPARAIWGSLDDAPAATLLIPHFAVGLDNRRSGVDTLFTVTNTDDAMATIAHVTLWTDWGLPTINFNIQLAPRASVEIDLADLFYEGELAFPAFGGETCDDLSASMPATLRELSAAHQGKASDLFGGDCGAVDLNDSIARGFVTVDTVQNCTTGTPLEESYFMSTAVESNVLAGSYTFARDPAAGTVSAPAVHLEADSALVGLQSFYFLFGPVHSTLDAREPLVVGSWTASYDNDLTQVLCWTDRLLDAPFDCAGGVLFEIPQVVVRDHSGASDIAGGLHGLCTRASVKLAVGSSLLPADSKSGSLSVILSDGGIAVPSGASAARPQSWVSAIHSLHPGGPGVLVPGVATKAVVLPLATGAAP